MKSIGYAALSAGAELLPFDIERRALRPNDVALEILYSGICHSDLHQVKNDWGFSIYPMVPGHEIIGKVIAIGAEVKKYGIDDIVGVGCMVDSCLQCDQCKKGYEQFCREGSTMTYNGMDRLSKTVTFGGYSKHLVAREEFLLSIPKNLDISRAAPILCAGITTFSPLRHYQTAANSRVGVIGLGGLGHMAVKLAKAMGANVTVISHSDKKREAAKATGSDHFLLSSDKKAMQSAGSSMDLIINTIPIKHNISPYIPLLDVRGTMVMVGQIGPLDEPNISPLILGNRSIAGSIIGGIRETQEVLDFCALHQIHPECEIIGIDAINQAFARLEKGEVPHRFVIDMTTLGG